jgi:cytochrome c peroxidase
MQLNRKGLRAFFAARAQASRFERPGCGGCHSSKLAAPSENEVFTNFRYYNLGAPPNLNVRALSGGGCRQRWPV